GRGRLSNAVAESYFEIIKECILKKKTRLKPSDAILKIHLSTMARLEAGRYGLTQTAAQRKSRAFDVLMPETWRRRKSQSRGKYFRRAVSVDKTVGQKRVQRSQSDDLINRIALATARSRRE
ncbi:unnamed protein product, partial [Didymodactylos carnosus]